MMEKEVSFLLEINRMGLIVDIFWYHPIFLLSPYQKNIVDLFVDSEKERLVNLIQDICLNQENKVCLEHFRLINLEIDISMCFARLEEKILIVGYNGSLFKSDAETEFVRTLLDRFMKVIASLDTSYLTKNELMVRDQFEQIQKLNNELLNVQRLLKRANAQLNRLNVELNNRLVKDALTGLTSRYQYREEIDLVISKTPEKYGIFAFIDIDNFKNVNDTFGHRVGDELLKEFAHRLQQLPFSSMIAMRISGDEFGLYIHGYNQIQLYELESVWLNIQDVVTNEPIIIDGNQHQVRCSVGMAIYNLDTNNVYDLIEFADFAMYEAKKTSKNTFSLFDKNRYAESKLSLK